MAQIEKMIPFLILWETGVSDSGADNENLFIKARRKGIVNVPDDSGGATMVGITIATYRDYCRRKGKRKPTIYDLSCLGYAEWLDILKTMFWDQWQADLIDNQSVAEMLVDWVWTSGSYGITIPQKLLEVKVDGIVGTETLHAVSACDSAKLFRRIKEKRIDYIESICRNNPKNLKFRNGWLRRIAAVDYISC